MNPSQIFETITSLQLQVLLVVGLVTLLDRLINCNTSGCSVSDITAAGCRLWTTGFVSIIALIAAGFLVPHFRLVDVGIRIDESTLRTVFSYEVIAVKLAGVVWIVGCSFVLLRRLVRCIALTRFMADHCKPMSDAEIAGLPLTAQDELPGNVCWLVSDGNHGPFCWQMQRPTVVLPSYILRETPAVIRHVLIHELEHLRTNHPLQHFLQGVCSILLWFHPAIWWAARRAELTREFHCDAVSASAGNAIGSYLRTLAIVAEQNATAPACTLAFGRRKSAIIRRTERLVSIADNAQFDSPSRARSRVAISILCLILTAAAVSQLWLPVNVLASTRTRVSPWPSWTASLLHDLNISARDFEHFDHRHELHDLLHGDDD